MRQMRQDMEYGAMVIGIDSDYHQIAWAAVLGDGAVRTGTIDRADYRGRVLPEYDASLRLFLERVARCGGVVYLEGAWLGRSPTTFARLNEVHGEIQHEARLTGVDVVMVAPSKWQHSVLGFARGRDALKKASHTKALEICGPGADLSEHEADAVCIACYGQQSMETRKEQPV